ncbi:MULTISPECIES: TetR/AcrR family transcriptional regulator [unclassified Ruegeria]|uniref:TetR/AcrR family transcriptional regulator n=1 Tax=unclassified Ruegeria TaxID=2625375 RepID=UPI001491A6BA|nr:TetR family transcriptional regulator [Ruegeria sp. HKCCD5849]NOD53564.1 TetR family transcriptional regulator [Ruegeria sp. HKCCD5851]NOD69439.1 TetR family transcriptional regulator [Ruegeria sp. HKCCD7303]
MSKRDWLNKALEILVAGGIDAVRVVDLARKLNVAKSGFYWHFRDRNDLLDAMKFYWIEEFSQEFMEDARAFEGSVREKTLHLIRVIREKESGKLDLAFASWAQTDASVRDLVDRVRDMRIEFAKGLLNQAGTNESELEMRARLFVVYFMWSEVVFETGPRDPLGEDLNAILNIIVGER